jgi:small subunit ribosomal protein S1
MSGKLIRRRKSKPIIEEPPEEEINESKKEVIRPRRPKKKHNIDEEKLLAELEDFEMDDHLLGTPMKRIQTGETISGTVTRTSKDFAFVDIGSKSEAILELSSDDEFSVGQEVSATVIRSDGRGIFIATKLGKSTDINAYQEAFEHHLPVEGKIVEANAGGFKVQLGSITGFCPKSHVDLHPQPAENYINQSFEFEILELKPREIILSRKILLQKERELNREKLLASLKIGEEMEGRVVRCTSFGVFVDLNGIDGLIGKRTLDRYKVTLNEGDNVLVSIEAINGNKISLSVPNLDPWSKLGIVYNVGGSYAGTIISRKEFGIFIQIEPGLEGLVHKSNLSENPNENPLQFGKLNDSVTVHILSFDTGNRRLELSIRAKGEEEHIPAPVERTKFTFGDAFGDILSKL